MAKLHVRNYFVAVVVGGLGVLSAGAFSAQFIGWIDFSPDLRNFLRNQANTVQELEARVDAGATDLDCAFCVNPGEISFRAVGRPELSSSLQQSLQELENAVAVLQVAVADLQAIHGLIVNGDFEAGNVGFSSVYAFNDNLNGPALYTITSDPSLVHGSATSYFDHTSGTAAGKMMAVNGGDSPDEVVWAQTVLVQPNRTYRFSLWHSSWFASNPAQLAVRINGIALGPSFFAPGATGVWELYEANWNSGALAFAAIEIINLSTIGDVGAGNDFALDDISLE